MASSQQHLPSYIVLILKKILHSSITIQLRTSLYYNPLGRLNLIIPTFSFEPKHENNITKKKKKTMTELVQFYTFSLALKLSLLSHWLEQRKLKTFSPSQWLLLPCLAQFLSFW